MRSPREWLQDPNIFSTSALILLTDAWGTEFFEWDPATVEMELKSTFGIEPSKDLYNRVNAATSLFNSNLFFLSLENFCVTCNTFNFGVTSSEVFIPADLDDVIWGISEARILLGETEDYFSHNIARYVGFLLSESGIKKSPEILSFAELDERQTSIEQEAFTDEIEAEVYYKKQEDEVLSLNRDNNYRLLALFRQVSNLPVKYGSVEHFKDRLTSVIDRKPISI